MDAAEETEGTVFDVVSIFINFLLNPFENVFLWVIIIPICVLVGEL